MAAQNLFQATVKEKNGKTFGDGSETRVLNSGRIISCETQASGADCLIWYRDLNHVDSYLLDDTYAAVAGASGYMSNTDKGEVMSMNLLERKGKAYVKTLVVQQDNFIIAWADPDNALKSYVEYDERPGIKSVKRRYKVNHSLLELTVLSGDVTTTSTTTTTTTTTSTTTTTTTAGA